MLENSQGYGNINEFFRRTNEVRVLKESERI